MDFLKSKNKASAFNAFQTYLALHGGIDRMNLLRLVYNGKTDLFKKFNLVHKGLGEDSIILERVVIGKKTSGWVSDFIDCFFASLLPDEYEKSPKGMLKYFEENDNAQKRVLSEFKYNFSELYSLFNKMYAII